MYSYRSKAYAILIFILFIHEYSSYFKIQINNKIAIYCDNKEIVTKIDNIRDNVQYYEINYNVSEYEEIIAINTYLFN